MAKQTKRQVVQITETSKTATAEYAQIISQNQSIAQKRQQAKRTLARPTSTVRERAEALDIEQNLDLPGLGKEFTASVLDSVTTTAVSSAKNFFELFTGMKLAAKDHSRDEQDEVSKARPLLELFQNDISTYQNRYGIVDVNKDSYSKDLIPMVFNLGRVEYQQIAGPKTLKHLRERTKEVADQINNRTCSQVVSSFYSALNPQIYGNDILSAVGAVRFDSVNSIDDFKNIPLADGRTLEQAVVSYEEQHNKRQKTPAQTRAQRKLEDLYKRFQKAQSAIGDREEFLTYGMKPDEKNSESAFRLDCFNDYLEHNVDIDADFLYVAALRGEVNPYDFRDVTRLVREVQTSQEQKYVDYRTSLGNVLVPTRDILVSMYGEEVITDIEAHPLYKANFPKNKPFQLLEDLIIQGESAVAASLKNAETGEKGVSPFDVARCPESVSPKRCKDAQLTKKTFNEILALQRSPNTREKLYAIGAFQVTQQNIEEMIRKGIIDGNELCTPDAQRRMLVYLVLNKRGINIKNITSMSTKELNDVIDQTAAEWRSFFKHDNTPWNPNDPNNKPTIRAEKTKDCYVNTSKTYKKAAEKNPLATNFELAHLALTGKQVKPAQYRQI